MPAFCIVTTTLPNRRIDIRIPAASLTPLATLVMSAQVTSSLVEDTFIAASLLIIRLA